MDPKDPSRKDPKEKRTEPRHDEKTPEHAAPPIEREHETAAGVFEEDERREREDS